MSRHRGDNHQSLRRREIVWLLIIASTWMSGCSPSSTTSSSSSANNVPSGAINVVATVGMVADLVKAVGGNDVEVAQLMGPGVDPHLYKATRDDVQQIMAADVVFYSGLMLEGRLADTLEKISKSKPVIAITKNLSADQLLTEHGAEGHPDPHAWMDVAAWSKCLDAIVDTLSQQKPEFADQFKSRADALRASLQKLHEYGVASIGSIPKERRVLVTSHDAFQYFGRAYGLEVLGVQGISTDSEAGLQRINELVDLLVERKVAAVFVESSVPQKNMMALIDGAKSRGHDVKVGGELFSDAMGAAGTYEGTYIGMLDHNITLVTHALGGTAPEAGLNGKLIGAKNEP